MVVQGTFRDTVDQPWTEMTPVRVGELPPGLGTPSVYVTIEHDGSPVLRIDVYEREQAHHAFQQVIGWGDLIVIGFGDRVHFVSSQTRTTQTFCASGYFGHLYVFEERLLVADSERLHCFDPKGSLVWRSPELGIDGVIVHGVMDGVIDGEGEWDPPGGWRSFRLVLSSGTLLSERE